MTEQVIKKETTSPKVISRTDTEIIPQDNDYDIDGFLAKRSEFITKVNSIMVEKADYHVIQGKKSLAKGGAEKIASIFGWTAEFSKDTDVLEAFKLDGLIAFNCNLTKFGQRVGQGRGAATLQKNAGDPNKTIKMAQKSAFIDAVLRASGLSDFFTQDLEDMPKEQISQPTQTSQKEVLATEKQLKFIKSLMKEKGIEKLSDIGFNPTDNGKFISMGFAKEIIEKLLSLGEETSVDKARRILNAKVPEKDYNANGGLPL